ncbi:Os01g0617200 [Oryza sativa Japonica Group]|uniref:Os01g0617200 protein n=1 Tax=Oryza sativa subsp. japonica TaxID=39947 RepID=A0A0P0V5A0_ORYSJ|nr:hypothetical protein EE612_004082 [Oryza sativa]BAS73175.1 Os01g0617200 [Oryza sativa Japonica Group]
MRTLLTHFCPPWLTEKGRDEHANHNLTPSMRFSPVPSKTHRTSTILRTVRIEHKNIFSSSSDQRLTRPATTKLMQFNRNSKKGMCKSLGHLLKN